MRKTPLFDTHQALGGKIVDFNGWALPVQYAGIIQEHLHTRTHASLFDCSHMGEFVISGSDAIAAYDAEVISDVAAIKVGRGRYGALLNDDGGIVDDVITMRLAPDELYVVTNAGPLAEVSARLCGLSGGVRDVSAETAKIDIQGPASRDVLVQAGLSDASRLSYFGVSKTQWRDIPVILSRTGYTGELGFEIFLPGHAAAMLWDHLSQYDGVSPAGLGARDTLRTEQGYGLSGQDFGPNRTPLEAGLESFIHWQGPFRGKGALERQREQDNYPRLTAIRTADRRAPRHDFKLWAGQVEAGIVTSGTYGPSVEHGIGLAYLPKELSGPGHRLVAGPRELPVETTGLPFYTQGTCRA